MQTRTSKLAAVLLSAAVALPSLANGFVWDDTALITQNPAISAPLSSVLSAPFLIDRATQSASYYRPVTQLWYALLYRIAGPTAWVFHAANIALELLTVWLAASWIERRLRSQTAADGPRLARAVLFGTLLFALHPTRPQSTAWIAGAGDLLCCLWFLLASATFERGGAKRAASALCCGLAALSKESGVIIPLALGVDAALRAPDALARKRVLKALPAPLCAIALASVLHALFAPATPHGGQIAFAPVRALVSLGYAASAVVWPWNPRFQLNVSSSQVASFDSSIQIWFGLGVLVVAAVGVLVRAAYRRPQLRASGADVALCLLTLAPSLNWVPIGAGMTLSERYLTLPLIALGALVARAALRVSARLALPATLLATGACLAMAAFSVRETRFLASERDLYEHFVAQDPDELFSLERLLDIRLRAGELFAARALSTHRLRLIWRGGSRADARQVSTAERATALLSCVRFELLITSDEDQARLRELRDVLDALDAGSGAVARLRLAGEDFQLAVDRAARDTARAPTAVGDLREDRALAHARTLDLATAERIAREWSSAQPYDPRAARLQVRVLLWQDRYAEALALLDAGRDAGLVDMLRSAAQRWEPYRALPNTEVARLVRAQLAAELGLPARAIALIRELAPSPQRTRVEAAIAIADKRLDRARALGIRTSGLPFSRSSFAEYERAATRSPSAADSPASRGASADTPPR